MIDTSQAEAIAAELAAAGWDVHGDIRTLASTQDCVAVLDTADGDRAVLKVSSTDRIDEDVLHAEAAALVLLDDAVPWLAVPLLQPGRDGRLLQHRRGWTGRMMSWVGGTPLVAAPHWRRSSLEALGRVAGQISRALEGFTHEGLRTELEWDPRQAIRGLERLIPRVDDDSVRTLLTAALTTLTDALPAAEAVGLPEQAVHLDLTDRNIQGDFDVDGTWTPTGIIDFGDMIRTWRISELAVAIHAALSRSTADPLAAVAPVIEGFTAHCLITEVEADQLWTLVLGRAAVCVAIETTEAADSPDNDYVDDTARLDVDILRSVLAVPGALARAVIRGICGHPCWPADIFAEMRRADPAGVVETEEIEIAWPWQSVAELPGILADQQSPDAMRLGITIAIAPDRPLRAPLGGHIVSADESTVTLVMPVGPSPAYLRLADVTPACEQGDMVERGQAIARSVDRAGTAEVTVHLAVAPDLPEVGKVRERDAWAVLCPNPAALVGLPQLTETPAPALEQRRRHVAGVQKTYYRTPPVIERARGQWMFDDTGRRYLDMVNNVAIVGHSHPRVTAAATEQLAVLNTNSRFLYRAMSDYADKIAATLPPELSSIVLVNSGSEAMELALQIARAFTSRRDFVAQSGAYHGWTTEVFELCTMPGDRPNWQHELAAWVHVADCPDWFRGPFGAAGAPYVQSLSDACQRAVANGGLAGFVHEPISGSRGGVLPPPGYLADAYAIVREHGGLTIADEVQVGYGRTGKTFWAFQSQNVVPDIVASAKAAGNGHPVGFVACRPDIAEAFAATAGFFSTPGGSPVSCRIGSAVLDVIHDEHLQDNALAVGDYLSSGLARLQQRHPEIGAIYGHGLYQGIDLVCGDGSTKPLPAAAIQDICERLLELGCIVQPTGLLGNVLKVKPPLCIDLADADCFLAAVDQVLTEREEFRALRPPARNTLWSNDA